MPFAFILNLIIQSIPNCLLIRRAQLSSHTYNQELWIIMLETRKRTLHTRVPLCANKPCVWWVSVHTTGRGPLSFTEAPVRVIVACLQPFHNLSWYFLAINLTFCQSVLLLHPWLWRTVFDFFQRMVKKLYFCKTIQVVHRSLIFYHPRTDQFDKTMQFVGCHDDVIKWKHFQCYWPFCVGSSPVTGEFPLTKASDAELWCFLWSAPGINGWVNNREAGDLRCNGAYCDVIVMYHMVHQLLKPEYSGQTKSIPWQLRLWLLAPPGHQKACYWLFKIYGPFLSTGKDLPYLCIPMENTNTFLYFIK